MRTCTPSRALVISAWREEAGGIIDVIDEELERDRLPGGCDELQATLKGCGTLVEVRDRVRRRGMREQAFVDLGVLAHDPLEDGEPDREYEIDTEDRPDDAKDDLFQEPQGPHGPQ